MEGIKTAIKDHILKEFLADETAEDLTDSTTFGKLVLLVGHTIEACRDYALLRFFVDKIYPRLIPSPGQ